MKRRLWPALIWSVAGVAAGCGSSATTPGGEPIDGTAGSADDAASPAGTTSPVDATDTDDDELGAGELGAGGARPADPVSDPDPQFASAEIIATRLAHMIWNSSVDQGIVDSLGAEVSPQSVAETAAAMLQDPRARAGIDAFYRWWLFFDSTKPEDESIRAVDEQDTLASSLRDEAPALGVYLTLDTDGTFADLLTAPYTFVNESVAQLYGITGVSGTEMQRAPYPTNEPRVGLLSGAGVLSFFSSLVNPSWPAKRSWLITDPLLCTPTLRTFLPTLELDVTQSIRQQMIEVTADASCMGCHEILNSPGFAFIGFDSTGRWHPEPGAADNETEGWIPAHIMPDEPHFDGPAELAQLLLEREETRRCFVRQWMQFALNRDVAVSHDIPPDDEASVEAALQTFTKSGLQLSSAIVAVAQTDAFLR